ncbi:MULTISPECIES: GntR family transcriptional regulator [Mycobacteriaceae]|uniref:GntR family transcriptional regulator n=1 Tax=Mycolicibacterium neoaurum VKM Ac-1815D TaxID=700508 RepID=V5XES1_MYCNE|nr:MULTISPECIES: GntR family transcriptional regulator [Mycobacteriaceae]AMO06318.1 GntR family transcriptional regulator [Mycolicibacterium neoaurum]AXK75335.1 GntR family transcriptional regulator [Mycolicibacterium neoaurum]KUM08299.1 GntR family transcriptional regulator [Mycolicibacterium neoaurum]MDO3399321.1 GntR family transcriptional regulator [Mycolicibacterium neoaurum]WBP92235.1 GntR family transcriptional regulator [Mycolicibacterium neoaurum]
MAAPRMPGPRQGLPATLVDVAADRLRAAILSGALLPGQKLVEEQLCADLGISRAPLREALRLLAQQGLVEHLPRRGSRVTVWSPTDILQLFALRNVLERHAMELALPLADPATDLEPVRRALEEMARACDELDRDDAHRRFHAAVVALAGNRQLDIALAPILLKLQLPMAMNLREEARHHRARDGLDRHRAILTALETNDPATVITALAEHGHLQFLELPDR